MAKSKYKPNQSTDPENNNEDPDYACGLAGWSPAWMQPFNNIKVFMLIFSILGLFQSAYFTYMVGIISTLEKRFAFDSRVTGFILISDNLSQMVISPVVGYLGGKYNQSRMMAIGLVVVGLACFMSAIPYFMYGPALHLMAQEDVVASIGRNVTLKRFDLCYEKMTENCTQGDQQRGSTLMTAVVIIWVANFIMGIGYTVYYTLGLPYLDDNVGKKNSSVYISTLATFRLLGPTTGFMLSSFSLSLYENPFVDPGINNKDPRWIGAWWLGYLVLGTFIIIFSIPMFFFPKKFKRNTEKSPNEQSATQQDGVWKATRRLVTNKLLLFHLFGGIIRVIGYLGYWITKPKYMELQYRQTASSASFFTGASSVVIMAVGIMLGGIAIRRYKPSARYIALFVILAELINASGFLTSMFLKCPTPKFQDISANIAGSCNAGCDCSTQVYQPVCGADGVTNYFSPCIAGCRVYDKTLKKFNDCSCVGNNGESAWASNGLCKSECNKFPLYIAILTATSVITSSSRTGEMLITLRAVEPRDKSFAMGIIGTMFAVFAYIPYPLVFGWIVDSACLIWEKSCGKKGNCWLYDIDKFRVNLHVGALTFLLVGTLFEIGTVVYAGQIKDFYDEEEEEEKEKEKDAKNEENYELKDID